MEKNYIANITLIRIILSIITFILIFILVHIIGYDEQTIIIIYILTLYTIFNTFSQLYYAVFQAHEKMEYYAIGTIINGTFLIVGVKLAIHLNFDIIKFSLIYLISATIILIYAVISYSVKFSLPKIAVNINQWKYLIGESWPFAITSISINIYTWIDTIILSIIQGTTAVGLYNASYKLVLVFIFIPSVLNTAVFPLMSQYYLSSKKSLSLTFEKLLKIMMILAIPLGTGTVLIAKKVIILVYGPEFLGAVLVMQILIWSIVLIFARSPFERLLESSNRQLVVTKVFIIGVIFNVILNLIVIPKYSYVGAGIITVLTDAIVLILLIRLTNSMGISISKDTKISLIKIVIASLLMGISIKYILYVNIFLLIGIGVIIYILSLFVLKIFDDEEILIIKSVFKK